MTDKTFNMLGWIWLILVIIIGTVLGLAEKS